VLQCENALHRQLTRPASGDFKRIILMVRPVAAHI
jgi:hypothetical protein